MQGTKATASPSGDRLRLIALNMMGEVGPAAAAAWLYRTYGRGQRSLLEMATGQGDLVMPDWPQLPPKAAQIRPGKADIERAQAECARAGKLGVKVVTWLDPEYPEAMRYLQYQPPVLYVRGTLRRQDRSAVAVVGSRRATPDYVGFASDLSFDLARAGMTVVSGLARGIDRAAHRGALDAGGRTLAVLGSGVDVVYPKSHGRLADEIAQSGAVISYYPLGTPPLAHHFPARNWVIASLALATVVVQAGERSGAGITAGYALSLGRDVLAVPGHVEHPLSEGPHGLIRAGAPIVTSARDVLWEMERPQAVGGETGDPKDGPSPGPDSREGQESGGGDVQARLRRTLSGGPKSVDALSEELGLEVEKVRRALVLMEIEREVVSLGGGRYRLMTKGLG